MLVVDAFRLFMALQKMSSQTRIVLVSLALMAVVSFVKAESSVDIVNHVGDTITTHCSSSDNDFGLVTLLNGKHQFWSFKDNIWGSTLYSCAFRWNNLGQGFVVWTHDHLEHALPCGKCLWVVQSNGFYLWVKGKKAFVHYYDWLPTKNADPLVYPRSKATSLRALPTPIPSDTLNQNVGVARLDRIETTPTLIPSDTLNQNVGVTTLDSIETTVASGPGGS